VGLEKIALNDEPGSQRQRCHLDDRENGCKPKEPQSSVPIQRNAVLWRKSLCGQRPRQRTVHLKRSAHFRAVAENLQQMAATELQYDIHRRDQLLALAAGVRAICGAA
jgi:hypothetical protein